MARRPKEPPGGSQSVRSSDETGNDRGAKGTQESGWPMNGNNEQIKMTPAPVVATPQQAGEAPARRDPLWWVERCVWSEDMWSRLALSEPVHGVWFRRWDKTEKMARHGWISLKQLHDWKRPLSSDEPTDWRAGCGRSARPVRRVGRGSIPGSYPIQPPATPPAPPARLAIRLYNRAQRVRKSPCLPQDRQMGMKRTKMASFCG